MLQKFISMIISRLFMAKQYVEKEGINKILDVVKKYSKENFKFTKHYWIRIQERQINHEFLLKTFFEFDKLRLIEEDVLPKGDTGYDLYYEISKDRTLIVGVIPLKNDLLFIHGILRYRNWQSALKLKN